MGFVVSTHLFILSTWDYPIPTLVWWRTLLKRAIVYIYDNLYRLIEADYTTGENYQYSYDKVGNRLQQIIDGDTTTYLYDDANRLEQLNGQAVYQFDPNGNLLNSDTLTNTFDAANRLIETERASSTLEPIYNGVGDRVGQTVGLTTTYFALDSASALPEVIYTTEGNLYLHLPGVMMAESGTGEVRYLLSDGLGSIRQAVDERGEVVVSQVFDPYGNPIQPSSVSPQPYGFTGEWWEDGVGLLHLRARWYLPETGTFLSRDAWEGVDLLPQTMNGWNYVTGNPINLTDPGGLYPPLGEKLLSCYSDDPDPICYEYPGLLPGPVKGKLPNPPTLSSPTTPTISTYPRECRSGDWFTTPGYAEGFAGSFSGNFVTEALQGIEIVYDFATMERASFEFEGEPLVTIGNLQSKPGLSSSLLEGTYMEYAINLNGFHSIGSLDDQYSGRFVGWTLGYGPSYQPKSSKSGVGFISAGSIWVTSPQIDGSGTFSAIGPSVSPSPIPGSIAATNYRLIGREYRYAERIGGLLRVTKRQIEQMKNDIRSGINSPWGLAPITLHLSGENIAEREMAIKSLEEVWQTHQNYFSFQYDEYKGR